MEKIEIIEKPDNITWEEVTNVIYDGYTKRLKENLFYAAVNQTKETTEQRALNGKCWLALKNNEIVGTITCNFYTQPIYLTSKGKKKWYIDDYYAHIQQFAVKEKYQGLGIGKKLRKTVEDYCKQKGIDSIIDDTSVEAKDLWKWYTKLKHEKVDYISWNNTNYYTVVRRQKINGKNINKLYRLTRYYISKISCIILYKKTGGKRFNGKKA